MNTTETDAPNSEQAAFWSSGGGLNWITLEPQLDALFANVNKALIKQACPQTGQKILDVGCGTGATSRDFAAQVGSQGHVHGIDISTSMLARAKETAPLNASFDTVDAQTSPLSQSYDQIVSRFGVMFFADPVAAFQNLRLALKPTGSLTMACWAPFKQNPWFTIPRFIATDLLGAPPPFDPRAPGPFAFADTQYTMDILATAGFFNGRVQTLDIDLCLQGDTKHAAMLSSYIGPADSVIREMGGTDADKEEIIKQTEVALQKFVSADCVIVPSKIHIYTANNQSQI